MNKSTVKWGLLLAMAGSGVVASVIAGCGKDACQSFADDLVAKYKECGIVSSSTATGTTTGTAQQCTDALAKKSTCLDGCVPKIDCPCTKDPTGTGCADKLKPYTDCVTACAQTP